MTPEDIERAFDPARPWQRLWHAVFGHGPITVTRNLRPTHYGGTPFLVQEARCHCGKSFDVHVIDDPSTLAIAEAMGQADQRYWSRHWEEERWKQV